MLNQLNFKWLKTNFHQGGLEEEISTFKEAMAVTQCNLIIPWNKAFSSRQEVIFCLKVLLVEEKKHRQINLIFYIWMPSTIERIWLRQLQAIKVKWNIWTNWKNKINLNRKWTNKLLLKLLKLVKIWVNQLA